MRRGPELIHNPVNLAVLNRKRELVRFAHAQFNAVGIAQAMTRYPFAVHPGAVAAVQILDEITAAFATIRACKSRGPVVAQYQVIIGCRPIKKGKRVQRHARALSRRMQPSNDAGGPTRVSACVAGPAPASAFSAGSGPGRRFSYFLGAQGLAVRTIAADLSPRQQNLKPEVRLHLAAQPLQRFAEKLLHLPQRRQITCACSCLSRVS